MEAEEHRNLMQDIGARVSLLSCLRRFRIFIFALAIVFLIMASYILNNAELFLVSFPYHRTQFFNHSFTRDSSDMAQVLHRIHSNSRFTPRKLPDMVAVIQSEAHIFSVIPRNFLPDLKNPCWYEELEANNTYEMHYGLRDNQKPKKHVVIQRDGKWYHIRCMPYFYVIGQPKCGTTDLYFRLHMHPDTELSPLKEPHWWTRKKFGVGTLSPIPVENYLNLFNNLAQRIQSQLLDNRTEESHQINVITGEASASTMWDNSGYFNVSTTEAEAPILTPDLIHTLNPDTRLLAILRNPVERLYSDYLYFNGKNISVEDFHERVVKSIQIFDGCLQKFSFRACVYSKLQNAMPVRLHIGLYALFLIDWLSVFSRNQLLVLRLEDHAVDKSLYMNRVFRFLDLSPLSEEKAASIAERDAANTRRKHAVNLGPMLPHTRCILTMFYSPFNRNLSTLLNNTSFLWEEHSTHC